MKDRKTFLTNLKEAELIKLLKTKLIPDLQDTSEFNRKDGYSPSTDVIFEFKCRTYLDIKDAKNLTDILLS